MLARPGEGRSSPGLPARKYSLDRMGRDVRARYRAAAERTGGQPAWTFALTVDESAVDALGSR